MSKAYYVYILSNRRNTVLYTGITSDLVRRVYAHKQKCVPGFSKTYDTQKLIYYEEYTSPMEAIAREKQIKAGSRKKKIALIDSLNPTWSDLYPQITR